MVERMLEKGDKLKPLYRDFDYSKLSQEQLFWIDKLSFFSKYRTRVINRYNGTTVCSDIKIMFLD